MTNKWHPPPLLRSERLETIRQSKHFAIRLAAARFAARWPKAASYVRKSLRQKERPTKQRSCTKKSEKRRCPSSASLKQPVVKLSRAAPTEFLCSSSSFTPMTD